MAFRFVIFGIGGFAALYTGGLALMFVHDPPGERMLSPVLIPLLVVGAVMMLYGSGQWGRWHYLWVFLSIPVPFSVLFFLAKSFPNSQFLNSMGATPLMIIWFSVPMPITYLLVKKYYRTKEAGSGTVKCQGEVKQS